ncbi:unnamed protein product [Ilex paraguariensis]|uniref:RRM domain-containing protein n=1 Tax=Ilex paraguariensis TaxID=185542 RepID=A0ABC8T3X7_9AQUA
MDVDSPEDGFEEISDLLNEDSSILAGEVELNFVANKEEKAEDYVFDNLASSNEFHLDMTEQGQQEPPLLPSDFRCYEISGCHPQNFRSPLQRGFDHDIDLNETKPVCDPERLQFPSSDNHHQDVTEELCGSYLCTSSFSVQVETVLHDNETGVSAHPLEFLLMEDTNQEEVKDRPASLSHDEKLHEALSETSQNELKKYDFENKEVEEDVPDLQMEELYSSPISQGVNNETMSGDTYYSKNKPAEGTKLEMSHSRMHNHEKNTQLSKSQQTERQLSVSPDTSHCVYQSPRNKKTLTSKQDLQDVSNSSRPQRQKHFSSPETSDLGKEVPSKDHALRDGRQNPASPRGSRQRQTSYHTNGSSVKRVSSSPKNHTLHLNRRGQDRSVSRSPVRRRDSSSVYKSDHRNRSRSRSPDRRDYHRRSPRRYSPRHRSPPSGYHSRRGSPRRRPWSPPHNRSTGVGKPGRNLFVAGFGFMTTERDLERKFSRFGQVRDVRIVRDKRSGDSRGFGFLSLQRDEEADAAIRALDKTEWNGRIVLVEKSKSH